MPARIISSSIDLKVPDFSIHKLIIDRLRFFQERTCLAEYETGNEYKCVTLLNDSLKVASALKKTGLNPGDIFMVYGFNCYEFVVALLSGLFVGGIALPVRGADTTYEFLKEIESKDVRLLFIDNELRNSALLVKKASSQIKDVILLNGVEKDCEFKCIRSILRESNKPLSDNEVYDPKGNEESIAFLLESSGTTGPTKYTQIGHYDFATPFAVETPYYANMGNQVILGASAVAHLSGLSAVISTLTKGSKVITVRNSTLENIISAIEKYKVARVILSPSVIVKINKLERPIDMSSLQTVTIGGSRLTNSVATEFVQKFKIKQFRNVYSMTEISMVVTFGENQIGHFESIGKIAPGIKIKVVDVNTERILGENETGEIRVKAPFKFKGYYKNEKLSKELIDSDGFIKTGDIGYFDEKENFFLIDRIKDIIKQNGFGFSPVDIEEVLLKHEAVEEVAVVGISDQVAGEISHAFVVLKKNINRENIDKQQMIDFVNKKVTNLKQLKGGIHWIDKLPKTDFGKVLRRKIREQYLAHRKM